MRPNFMIPNSTLHIVGVSSSILHTAEQEWQAAKILDSLIEQTAQQEYDEITVEGLIKKYEQLMS